MNEKILFIVLFSFFVISRAQTAPSIHENYIHSSIFLNEDKSERIETIEYMDGLGRPFQKIRIKAGNSGNDLVSHIEYDEFGRQAKDYLPIPMPSKDGKIQTIDSEKINAYYNKIYTNVPNAYFENIYDDSPINRIKQSAFPGEQWGRNSGNTIKYDYEVNQVSDSVRRFTTFTVWVNDIGTTKFTTSLYGTSELYKVLKKDEDDNTVINFIDKDGIIVLERRINNKINGQYENIDTYYVYNEYKKLCYIIPPLAANKIPLLQNDLDHLCYQYVYDSKGRVIEKKLPGKGWEYMVYDQHDRLVLTQDAQLRTANNNFKAKGWLFTKYDLFGRIVYTGFFKNTASRAVMQNALNSMRTPNREERADLSPVNIQEHTLYYTKNAFPTGSMTLLSVNYYDTYPPNTPVIPSVIFDQEVLSNHHKDKSIGTASMAVAAFVKNVEDDNWTRNYNFYDRKGRNIATHSYNHLGGYTKVESELDFIGMPKTRRTAHSRASSVKPFIIVDESFGYDHERRLKKHEHEVVGKSPKEILAEYTYNDFGQLTEKKVGGSPSPLQTINYSYNIRGWLTDINNIDNISNLNQRDLFAYKIRYDSVKGATIPNVLNYPHYKVKPKFNGNIAEVEWKVSHHTISKTPVQRYGYVYDGLNRMRAGFYQNGLNPFKGEYSEIIEEYDLNGNIKKLKRFSDQPSSTFPAKIDDLIYDYDANRLTSITDNPSGVADPRGYEGSGGLIEYNENGNMRKMPDKGIAQIDYNFLNLPTSILQRGNVSQYLYRSDGVKVGRSVTINNAIGSTKITTQYLDGFHYIVASRISKDEVLEAGDDNTLTLKAANQIEVFRDASRSTEHIFIEAENMILSFFPTSEGYYDYTKKRYVYQYKDQVGNIRVSYIRNPSSNLPSIIDRNDYYPLGMNFNTGAEFNIRGGAVNYKFQEQELQETGFYSFKWRQYMPDVGRFFNIDPLSEKYSYQSHYNFSENRLIDGREIEGLEHASINDTYAMAEKFGVEVEFEGPGHEFPILTSGIEEVIVTGNAAGNNFLEQFDFDITDAVNFGLDFVPFVGSGKDIYEGARDSDWLQLGSGIVGLGIDFATAGTGGLLKGGIKAAGKSFAREMTGDALIAAKTGTSLGAGRTGVKQWLQNAGNLERGQLIKDIEGAGFKKVFDGKGMMHFERGGMKIRLDPPQPRTPFNHMHLNYGGNKSAYDIFLNPVNYKSPAAHIPIR